jgi:hypothetical protein
MPTTRKIVCWSGLKLVGPKKGGEARAPRAGGRQPHPLYEAQPTPPSSIRNRNPRCVWQLRYVRLCYWYLLGQPHPWEDGYRDTCGTCLTSSPVRAAQVARRGVVRGGHTAWGPRQGTGQEARIWNSPVRMKVPRLQIGGRTLASPERHGWARVISLQMVEGD